jgi:hypothetical protein
MKKSLWLLPNIMASILVLSGCGAGSSNLDDPVTGPASSCTGDKCTPGIFSPVIEELDYKCANITATTLPTGYFSCPVDETVTFQISHPSSTFSVRLGSLAMKKVFEGATDKRYFVSVRDVAGSSSSAVVSNRELNSLALLYALNSVVDPTPGGPSDRIDLSNADKLAFLTALNRSLDAELDLAPADFALQVNSALNTAGKPSLASEATIRALLATSVNATAAGIYYSFAPLSVDGINHLLLLTTGLTNTPGFIGQSGGLSLLGHLAMGVDRRGRMFGFGEYVQGVDLRTATRQYMDFRVAAAHDLALAPSGNALLWPYSGNFKGLSFNLENGNMITLSQGRLERGAMASTADQFAEQYKLGTAAQSSGKLGAWTASGSIPAGRINLYRHGFIFPVLPTEVWDSITFPLHMTASVYKSSNDGADCTTPACLLKAVPLTILADGNVITDGDNAEAADCAAVDPVTLSDGSMTETPVGVVNRAYAIEGAAPAKLDISLLLPVTTFTDKRRHIELGTWSSAMVQLTDTFAIKVDGVTNAADWYDFFVEYSDTDISEIKGTVVFSPRTCI